MELSKTQSPVTEMVTINSDYESRREHACEGGGGAEETRDGSRSCARFAIEDARAL